MATENETAVFLGPTYTWYRASLELVDVQPLHGGVRVLVPSWRSGEAVVSHFARGGAETKYRIPLKWLENEKEQLIRLCVENDFLTIQPEQRLGLPDEARPRLTLTNSKRQSRTLAKWAGVKDERFDAIYRAMLALAARTTGARLIPKRFTPWQKWGTIGGIGAGLLLLPLVGFGVTRPFVTALWPERFGLLLTLLIILMALLLASMFGLAWWERRKPHWDRAYTHFWTVAAVNLCFFLAGIGVWGMVETAVSLWHNNLQLSINDEQMWYAILGYAAMVTAFLLLLLAGPLMPRLLTLIDERF